MNLSDRLCQTLRKRLESGGKPRLPAGGQMLWAWFCDLSRSRSYHAAGPNPISFVEIAAYRDLHRIPMDVRHVEILRAMDEVYLESTMKRTAPAEDGTKRMPKPLDQPMWSGLFDAMFG
ncbi:phage tail assembly chaperone [Pararhizobium gei]|uniref:phage tail assembly chaperone n=1 Tax=Pararhizobium gei TaxID=1395951 RepID=UPI0023DAF733|nr:hypothetical protein [Rhizobium gei]